MNEADADYNALKGSVSIERINIEKHRTRYRPYSVFTPSRYTMPRPYALQVTSGPIKVSEEIWTQWYTEEHIRDVVYSGASRTSAVYSASSNTVTSANDQDGNITQPNDGAETNFLALYQSTTPHVLQNCTLPDLKCKVRIHSSLFPPSSTGQQQTAYDVGVFRPVDLQLVEILGSYEYREDVATHILHHRIEGGEIENKIQFDHVNAVSGSEGYRRTLLYRPIVGERGGSEVGCADA